MLQIRGTELHNSTEPLQRACACVPLLKPPVCVRVRLRDVLMIHTCVTKPANTLQSFSYTTYRILYTSCFQVKVDMDEHIPSGPDIPTKLLATKNKAVVQAKLVVEGLPWHVTCVSMGVTFGAKEVKVVSLQIRILFMSTCFFS